MKILVISDSHGKNDDVEGVISQVGEIDMLIHCGDVGHGEDYIRSLVDCPVHMVTGNNDYRLGLPAKEILDVEGHRIFVTHGHRHQVYRDVTMIREAALEEGADIALYGHTHIPFVQEDEEVTILNPGSLSYPRQEEQNPTFLMMEIQEDGKVDYKHEYYYSKVS